MDINTLRTILTALSFVLFVGIVVWALSPKNTNRFDEAKHDLLRDDPLERKGN